jgi:hypothetical protein
MEKEKENAENLYFQLNQLQKEGKIVSGLKKEAEKKIWENSEKKMSPERPRWKIIDKDEGITFYQKGSKRMDIINFTDEDRPKKFRDILVYDTNDPVKTMMVRRTECPKKNLSQSKKS